MIAEIFSGLISVIQWPFLFNIHGSVLCCIAYKFGLYFFFSLENKH